MSEFLDKITPYLEEIKEMAEKAHLAESVDELHYGCGFIAGKADSALSEIQWQYNLNTFQYLQSKQGKPFKEIDDIKKPQGPDDIEGSIVIKKPDFTIQTIDLNFLKENLSPQYALIAMAVGYKIQKINWPLNSYAYQDEETGCIMREDGEVMDWNDYVCVPSKWRIVT
jgi:hypothetical protein